MSTLRRRLGSDSEQVPIVINAQRISHDERAYAFSTNKQNDNIKADEIEAKRMPKDRTTEFANAIRSLHGRQIIRAAQVRDVRKAKTLQSHGEFMMIAKNVGKNLTSTYTKLEKLTLLCKTKVIFDDKASEVQELSYIIKEDLKSLNEQLARLQAVCKKQRNPDRAAQNQHLFTHSNVVILALQSKLASMSNDFKQILNSRSDSIKQAKSRRDKFSLGAGSSNNKQNNPLFFLDNKPKDDEEREPLNNQQQQQQQQSLMAYHDHTDQYIQSRVETMHSIESTIVELGGIFQQLATMVKEQDEMVERIDTNIMDAEMNVEAAHHQILRYFQSVTSNRWLMIKVFMILIFFFTFFAVFLA